MSQVNGKGWTRKKVCLPLEGTMEKFLLGKGVQLSCRGKKLGLFPTVGYKMSLS